MHVANFLSFVVLASSAGTPPASVLGAPAAPLGMASTVAMPTGRATPTAIPGVLQPMNTPLVQPVMQPMMQPVMQPMQSMQQPAMQPMQQPVMQPMIQPMMQPMIQPMMQPMVQPMMQPVLQPMMQPMVQPVVPSNLPLLMQGTGSPVGMPLMGTNMTGQTGLISPPSVTGIPNVGSGFSTSSASFDGSKPNTPDSSKTVIRASSVASRESYGICFFNVQL